jgi:hypothetical protein
MASDPAIASQKLQTPTYFQSKRGLKNWE